MAQDLDPSETREWLDALDSVVEFDGAERAAFLIAELHEEARRHAVAVPFSGNTPYLNTIPVTSSRRTRATGRSSTRSAR